MSGFFHLQLNAQINAQAEAKLDRARDLIENEYLSEDTLLDRETDVAVWAARIQANEVALSVARRNLGKCRVTAAFGSVTAYCWSNTIE